MPVRSVGLGAMFGWIADSLGLFKANLRTMLSAGGLTLGMVLLMFLPLWGVMFWAMRQSVQHGGVPGALPMGGDMTLFWVLYVVTMLIGLLLFPPLLVGWFRLCRAADQGATPAAMDLLKPYRDPQLWMRSIRFALLALLVYLVALALFYLVFHEAISAFVQQTAAREAALLAGAAPPAADFPGGLILGYLLFLVVAMVLQMVYLLGYAEISLRETPVLQALGLAFSSVAKNALKLLLFLFLASSIFGIAFMIVAVVLALVVMALNFVHVALAVAAMVVFYVAILLLVYPLMFAGSYFFWKSALGAEGDAVARLPDSMISA